MVLLVLRSEKEEVREAEERDGGRGEGGDL